VNKFSYSLEITTERSEQEVGMKLEELLRTEYEHGDDVATLMMHSVRGAELIRCERQRQLVEEGYDLERDAQYVNQQLVHAAICYAFPEIPDWPWDAATDKRPKDEHGHTIRSWEQRREDRVRCLVKAGALIAAEIDRVNRLPWPTITPPENDEQVHTYRTKS